MRIMSFNHIGINVKEIEASLSFYCELLGLEIQKSVKMDDCTITYLLLPNGNRIELFDYYGRNKDIDLQESQVGYRHIAIEVDSVDEWEAHLRRNNVPIIYGSIDIADLGVRVLLFEDPSGVVIEFCETI